MATYQHLRVERQIKGIARRIVAVIVSTVGRGEEKYHEPHRKGHGEGLGSLREFDVAVQVRQNDDGERLYYTMIVPERSVQPSEVDVQGNDIVPREYTRARVHQVCDMQVCDEFFFVNSRRPIDLTLAYSYGDEMCHAVCENFCMKEKR